eukprot:475559-Prymnesium_polylepis.1
MAAATVDSGKCFPDLKGCMVPSGLNYDSLATRHDECTHRYDGCTSSTASNYALWANVDDSSCRYDVWGCADADARNFNPAATVSKGCVYDIVGCSDSTAINYASDVNMPRGDVYEAYLLYREQWQDEADPEVTHKFELDLQTAE